MTEITTSPSIASSSSSSSSRSWKYDVFLSFRGEDICKTFVDHLYSALNRRMISTCKDDESLSRGDTIGPSLLKAIEESQIALIIFSGNYANSSWCLDELAYIMKCREERGQIVMPIFYHVDPSEVRKQKGEFGKAFSKHELENNIKIKLWRKALVDASNIAGWETKHFANGHEAKGIEDIVGTILDTFLSLNSIVDKNLVGMETRLQGLKSKLQIDSGGVRMIGIWGIGGGGKTTLASSLYIEICGKFDSCCFLGNIKDESSKSNGMETLQEKILSTVFDRKVKVASVDIGKDMIKDMLCHRNVLIVLDDVDDREQLDALAGSHDWFGDGSRIVITTRDEHLLRAHNVNEVYNVSLLSNEEAIQLFNRCAYNENNPVEDYEMLLKSAVSYAAGLPLALKVLGSFLYDKDKDEWMSTLDRLKDIPEMEIMEKLKISYDGLESKEKELFLDIACFCRGMEKDEAMVMLDACGFHPVKGLKVLRQKGLITIKSSYKYRGVSAGDLSLPRDIIDMHDQVQEMGHYIVRGEHLINPEKHSRLWQFEDIEDMCSGNETKENNKTEAIICHRYPSYFHKLVSKAKKLRLLFVYNPDRRDIEVPEYLSNELRYMYWESYPASPFPESFQLQKLVVLRLEYSLQKELWRGNKYLPCLKELELCFATNLVRTPDIGGLPCLEKLTLSSCDKLKVIHPSLGNHTSLVNVFVQCCVKLHLYSTRQPSIFYWPRFLKRLTLSKCGWKDGEIPCDIGELSNLQELDLSRNEFSRLNFSLLQLSQLKLLNLERCEWLVELPELPSSIAILKADHCWSLEVVGDIHTNCKWLCQVSISGWRRRSVTGGYRLLQSMLKGHSIENGCMSLLLRGVEIPKGFIPPLLLKGNRYRLQLPENWYNKYSGFLMCASIRWLDRFDYSYVCMKHEKGGTTQQDVFWKESVYDIETWVGLSVDNINTWVGYVSFGSLKNTLWWDPTSTAIEFSVEEYGVVFKGSCSGFGVGLVSQRSESGQLETTTTDSSQSSNDYRCNISIKHDSESDLECQLKCR